MRHKLYLLIALSALGLSATSCNFFNKPEKKKKEAPQRQPESQKDPCAEDEHSYY